MKNKTESQEKFKITVPPPANLNSSLRAVRGRASSMPAMSFQEASQSWLAKSSKEVNQ